MKIICNKAKLSEAIAAVSRAVSKAASIPSLEGIYLDAHEDVVTMCGYNLEMGIRTKIDANVTNPGTACIPAKLLSNIITKMPDSVVLIETSGKNVIQMKSGKSKYKVSGYNPEEFPELPQPSYDHDISVPNSTLKKMIRQTNYAVAKTSTKPIFTGALFEIGEGRIRMIGVDGYRIAICQEPVESNEDLHFVVPGNTLAEVSRLISDDDKSCSITIGDRHAMFTIGQYTVVSRLLEGEFLDYQAAIPKNSAQSAVVSTNALISSV